VTDYYIFRHGDTIETGNILVRFFGHSGDSHPLPILPKGIPALEKIGQYLKNIPTDANFCSPYLRCMDSAKIVGKISGKDYKADERIRELEKNGEKFSHFTGRIKNFIGEIEKKNYSAVSICTHGAGISAIKHLVTSGKFSFFQIWDFPPPGNLTIIKNGSVEKINFNHTEI
jgi:broad specificity phosphatase PhoE